MIYGVEGLFGSGKSAFTSLAAVDHSRTSGGGLFANYSLKGAQKVHSIAELYTLRDGVLVIDEGHQTADSRNSGGKANLEFWSWFSQCRKQRLEVFLISQDSGMVDKRLREMMSVLFVLSDLGDAYSEVTTWKVVKGKPASRLNCSEFNRRWAYGLYDHEERAWPLVGAAPAVGGAAAGGGRALRVAS